MVAAALSGLATSVLCYGVGSVLFSATWRLLNRRLAERMQQREIDFMRRIAERRGPSLAQSHDYYGDKIYSLRDYRRWVKEQRQLARLQASASTSQKATAAA